MRRRTFLKLGAASAAATLTAPARASAGGPAPFRHGVASGDPLPSRVILWTRVTPSDDATPGSGLGAATSVSWQVARDAAFSDVVASGAVVSAAASDHTIKVDVSDLPAATDLWYRFSAVGQSSPVGRTRTMPALGADVDSMRIGVVACSNWEGGYFSAYRHLADRDDLDFVLHLGDYVYEYGVGGYGPGAGFGREHDPGTEMTVLEDYRRRHAQYKTDPDLARLHQRYAFITTIDDHEVADNSWSGGAANHQAPGEGVYSERRAQSFQAYFEWMPIRVTGGAGEPTRVYRSLPFGSLAELFVLDQRTYRDEQVMGVRESLLVTSSAVADPGRTLLGPDQGRWFDDGLQTSDARWKLIGNPVMFAPLVLTDVPDDAAALDDLLSTTLGISPPIVINADQWDGYRAEQSAFGGRFGEVGGVVILTGDIHSSWAAEIPADPATYLPGVGGDTTAVEFVTPGVTSDSFSAAFADAGVPAGEELGQLLPTVVTTAGPWFKYLDAERHGFGVFDLTPAQAQFQWFYVSDRTDPEATLVDGVSYLSPAGSNKLLVAEPLGPRGGPGPTPVPEPVAPPAPSPPPDGGVGLPATGAAIPVVAATAAAAAGLALRAAGGAAAEDGPGGLAVRSTSRAATEGES